MRSILLVLAVVAGFCSVAFGQAAGGGGKTLEFRGLLVMWDAPGNPFHQVWSVPRWDGPFWDKDNWTRYMDQWAAEGHTALVYFVPCELSSGSQFMARLKNYPEAQEIPPDQLEKNIEQVKWIFHQAKQRGMKNYIYTGAIEYTPAFAKAHGYGKEEISWLSKKKIWTNTGVRNEITRKYMEDLYAEIPQIYEDLEGYYLNIGEAIDGSKASYFPEAIAPGLKRAGRKLHCIIIHWQLPIDEFLQYVKPNYPDMWVTLHAWNSEQITDAKPYPFVSAWAELTQMPTMSTLYPANITMFPFNSPKFAFEITTEMKKIPNFRGYSYWEWSGRKLSPLFRKALAYYAARDEAYSPEPWLKILEEKYGDRQAAEHFLKAYDISARIIPETDALVWCGHDNYRRELRIGYEFFTGDWQPLTWTTDPVRWEPLQPVWNYAKWVAKYPAAYKNKEGREVPGHQGAIWRSVGGSVYDVIPPNHMNKVRKMGEQALAEADLAMQTVKTNRAEAQFIRDYMQTYQLLARYYERKVAAATAAMIYRYSHKPEDRVEAEKLADEAVKCHTEFVTYMDEKINPTFQKLHNIDIRGLVSGYNLKEVMEEERQERVKLAEIFQWPAEK